MIKLTKEQFDKLLNDDAKPLSDLDKEKLERLKLSNELQRLKLERLKVPKDSKTIYKTAWIPIAIMFLTVAVQFIILICVTHYF